MSDSKAPIVIEPETWTNLYEAAGIAVGTEVVIYLYLGGPLKVAIKATEPTTEMAGVLRRGDWYKVSAGESGIWVFSASSSKVAIQEA